MKKFERIGKDFTKGKPCRPEKKEERAKKIIMIELVRQNKKLSLPPVRFQLKAPGLQD